MLTADVLVLQVQVGKDTFITVRGSFVPTIVGLPLDLLPELPDVIRNIPLAVRKTLHDPVDWEAEAAEEEAVKAGDELEVVAMMSPTTASAPGIEAIAGSEGKVADGSSEAAGSGELTEEGGAVKASEEGVGTVKSPGTVGDASAKAPDESAPPSDDTTVASATARIALDEDVSSTPTATHPPPIITTTPPSVGAPSVPPSAATPTAASARPRPKRSRSAAITKPPREIWRLLERLMEVGMGVERLWTTEVDYPATLAVMDALDTGSDLPDNIHAIANALLHILYALPEPLVPKSQTWRCRLVMTRDDAYTVVEKVPGVHANVLIGLMSVARLCGGEDVDKESGESLLRALSSYVKATETIM